jgi:hypothetical protein
MGARDREPWIAADVEMASAPVPRLHGATDLGLQPRSIGSIRWLRAGAEKPSTSDQHDSEYCGTGGPRHEHP